MYVTHDRTVSHYQRQGHDSDPRVATLIQRAAQGASRAAMALEWDEDVLDAVLWTLLADSGNLTIRDSHHQTMEL